jgi:hypothetical protein
VREHALGYRSGSPNRSKDRTFRMIFQFAVPARSSTKPKSRHPKARRNPIFLAREWHDALESGEVSSRAELARKLGVSRARVTQVLRLLNLVPEVLDLIEALGDPILSPMVTERRLRAIVSLPPGEHRHEIEAMFTVTRSERSVRSSKTQY